MNDDIFDKSSLSARDQVDEWVSIKKKVGDSVGGTFVGWWKSPGNPGFKPQIGIALKQANGKIFAVSVGDTPYMQQNVATSQIEDQVGLKYEGEKDVGQIQKAKIIRFYNKTRAEREKAGQVSVGAPELIGEAHAEDTDDDIAF